MSMKKHIDTLFSGATFHTLRLEDEVFSFLGATGGRISYLANARPDRGEYKREVSLGGGHVYPSFTDAHIHLLSTVMSAAAGFDVCQITDGGVSPNTLKGVEGRIRAYCEQRGAGETIVANNYIASAIDEKRMPTRLELDDWTGGRRAVVFSIDSHSSSMSTPMLEALGVDPSGHAGFVSGADHEFLQGRVTSLLGSSVGIRDLVNGVADFVGQCAKFGITRVCALEGNGDSPDDRMARRIDYIARRLEIDIFLYPQLMDLERARPFWKKAGRRRIGGCGDWEVDGAVGAHSAAFYSPYIDTGATAGCYYTQEEIDGAVRRADAEGCQIAAHAIGEAAIDRIVGAFDRLRSGSLGDESQGNGPLRSGSLGDESQGNGPLRSGSQGDESRCGRALHRIEHFEFPTDSAVEKLIRNGSIAVTVQPGFAWIDERFLKSYECYLPKEIAQRQAPLKRLYDAGVALCATSDSPIQSLDPFLQLLGMADFSVPGESLTNYEAMRCYTVNPARVLGLEDSIGTLALGKEASFFATAADLTARGAETFSGAKVDCTYIRGRRLVGSKGALASFLRLLLRRPKRL